MPRRSPLAALALLGPMMPVVVDAGFQVADLTSFVGLLPVTCTEPAGSSIFDELFACVLANIAGSCAVCLQADFVAPPLPTELPTSCDDAGEMIGVVCALQSCCAPCEAGIAEAWTCSADGVPGIEAATCPLECTDDASSMTTTTTVSAGDTATTTTAAGTTTAACAKSFASYAACLAKSASTCGTCVMDSAAAGIPSANCDERVAFLCGLEACCPECDGEADALVENCKDLATGTECDVDCDAEADAATTTAPPSGGVATTTAPPGAGVRSEGGRHYAAGASAAAAVTAIGGLVLAAA